MERAAVEDRKRFEQLMMVGDSGPYYSPPYIHALICKHREVLSDVEEVSRKDIRAVTKDVWKLDRLSSIKQHKMLLAVAEKEELARGFYWRLKQYEKPEEASLIRRSLNTFDWKRIDAISSVDRDSARATYIDICVTSFDVKQDTL